MTTPTQAQIEAALKKYGDHTYECASNETIDPTSKPPCDCGWGEWKAFTAAVQVGEVFSKERYDALPQYDAETIERCAQVADNFNDSPEGMHSNLIAAAIRKLKDDAA